MENSYKFFSNRECKYFPCHKGTGDFNCLFCYCPFYMEERCPGNPSWLDRGDKIIKDCTNCDFPHRPENYERILELLRLRNAGRRVSDETRTKARKK